MSRFETTKEQPNKVALYATYDTAKTDGTYESGGWFFYSPI
jgi:hypothetical protein